MIIEMDTDLYLSFRAAVREDERTMNSTVRKFVREYMKKHDRKEQA